MDVEYSRLEAFYGNVSEWPKNVSDLAFTSENLERLLGTEMAGISIPGMGGRISILRDRFEPQSAKDLLEKTDSLIREKGTGGALLNGSIQSQDKGLISVRAHGLWDAPGWIFAGSRGALTEEQESLLVAASKHLADLKSLDKSRVEISLRDQFLSIASHELKTPLTSIYGVLQLQERMLKQKKAQGSLPEDQEKQLSFFKVVIRQVERLNELIDGLLNVSRIQVGRFLAEPSDADVSELLRETTGGRLSNISQEAGVQLQVDAPDHLKAWVDPIRFEEVVTNLGMNAIRFSPEGGVVWIKLRENGDTLVLSVRDQGPSVAAEDRERIFQPFERAQKTSRLGGLGLGLFISRQIAQLHGGTVALAESLPGKGNVFVATFASKQKTP